jgi:hypothetical protein
MLRLSHVFYTQNCFVGNCPVANLILLVPAQRPWHIQKPLRLPYDLRVVGFLRSGAANRQNAVKVWDLNTTLVPIVRPRRVDRITLANSVVGQVDGKSCAPFLLH